MTASLSPSAFTIPLALPDTSFPHAALSTPSPQSPLPPPPPSDVTPFSPRLGLEAEVPSATSQTAPPSYAAAVQSSTSASSSAMDAALFTPLPPSPPPTTTLAPPSPPPLPPEVPPSSPHLSPDAEAPSVTSQPAPPSSAAAVTTTTSAPSSTTGCSASASDTLAQAFSGATAPLPPPQHSAYFHTSNATATKLRLQAVIEEYLADMGSTVDMMASRSLTGLYQKESNYFKFFEYCSLHPEQLTPTTYDAALPHLGALYRQLVALVKDGASVTSKGAPKFMSRLHQRESSTWSPEDSYVNLPDVVGTGISELHSWVNDFLDAGLAAAKGEVAAIMKQKRQENLIPHVRSAQLSAQRAREWYEDKFQQFSSPDVYQDFVAARQELLDLELVA